MDITGSAINQQLALSMAFSYATLPTVDLPRFFRLATDWLRWAIMPPSVHEGRPAASAKTLISLFIPLFSVNLVVLALCAPHIKVDGSVYTTTVMRDFVVPHGAPLYPLFVRSVNAVVHNTAVKLGFFPAGEGSTWSLIQPAPYSDFSIYTILFTQHALLVWAAVWFATSITRRWWLRVVIAGALCWSPPILVVAQRIKTEGLWNPLVIAAVASCYRFLMQPNKPLRNLALHFLFVALAMLVRHPGSVFLAMLPLALVALGLARAASERRLAALLPHARAATIAVCIGLATLSIVSSAKIAVLVACDVEPRPAFGRPGTQRIHYKALHPYERMSRQDLDEIIQGLQQRTDDPHIQRAIQIITTSESFWVEPFNKIRTEIVEPAYPQYNWQQTLAPTDRILNQVAMLAYTSTDPRMMRSVVLRATRFLQLGQGLQKCGVGSLGSLGDRMDQATRAAQWPWLTEGLLANVSAVRDVKKLRRTLALEWTAGLVRPPETRILWFLTVVLITLTVKRKRFGPGSSTAVAVVTTAVIYASLLGVIACFSARRSEIIVLLALCAVALLFSELTERDRSTPIPFQGGASRPNAQSM